MLSNTHLLALTVLRATSQIVAGEDALCRCFPTDDWWPSAESWSDFNGTLGGKLIATDPLAAPCHDSRFGHYNATQCKSLQDTWTLPQTQ